MSAPTLLRGRRVRRGYLIAGLVLAAGAIAVSRGWRSWFPPPPVQVVAASGRIEGREVTIAPKDIQARVSRLLVDEGQTVVKGQLLAELEAANLDARLMSASASVAALEAQVGQAALDVSYTARNSAAAIAAAAAAVNSAQAVVMKTRAILGNATADHDRATSLLRDGVISKRDFDLAETALRTSEADADAADKDLARARANFAMAQAGADAVGLKRRQLLALQESRRAALGQLAEVKASVDERRLVAPANGTILSRLVEIGDVVSPGSPMFEMVDMSRLYVKVYIPEPDIGKLRLGDRASITVDAFPGRPFSAHVSKIHDEAEFTPKNVETADERLKLVFGVELAVDNPDGVLKPGMPADASIHWTAPPARASGHAR
ncbi:MAG TPA: efflux RND transporter periplasmic adaptor subunit [Vicinamibacterales bacterium]|nr:efflux RND transporter periplasmic adaptor subunit [Vicinamibacterales bacterium]